MAAAKKQNGLNMTIGLMPIADAHHYERNARTHPQSQIDEIKGSIRAFGFTYPMLVDVDDGNIIAAGHGRHMAMEQMNEAGEVVRLPDGREIPAGHIPFIDCSGWSPEQRRAYTLADNKVAENSGWDEELLKVEIGDLLELGSEAAPIIGFSDDELAGFAAGLGGEGGSGGLSENYSRKIEAPVYEPKGDKPPVADLIKADKANALKAEIKKARLPGEVAAFLNAAADRHTVFDFEAIAEYYCHAPPRVQELMEKSALVIIDFDKAIENGFVEMSQAVSDAWEKDHGGPGGKGPAK